MRDVAVVAYCRTAIAKAVRGALNQTHGIPMAAHVLREAVKRAGIAAGEGGGRPLITTTCDQRTYRP